MSLEHLRRIHPCRYAEIGGTRLEYIRTSGSGPTLVMLPGAHGTAESFVHQILAFGSKRDILSINYPGWADVSALANLVVDIAQSLGIQRFDVLGSSLGGYVAQWIAVLHHARVGRVVVGNSFDDPRPSQTATRLSRLVDRTADAVKQEVVERLLADPPSGFRDVMLDLVGTQLPAATIRDRMLAVQRAQPLDGLAPPMCPMLIVECADDPVISLDRRASLRGRYPDAQVATLESGGHYPYLVAPSAYNAALASFLDLR